MLAFEYQNVYFLSAVIIDQEFMQEEYRTIKESIEDYLTYAKREILKHGGVNVQYFSWTSINVKRGMLFFTDSIPLGNSVVP